MKRFMTRNSFLAVLFFALVSVAISSCSKDDDGPSGGIDAAVGTYIGTIDLIGDQKFFNAIVVVSKVDNEHIKIAAKSGEDYSMVTAKTVKVTNNSGYSIQTVNDPNGTFLYVINDKTVTLLTTETQEGDIVFKFDGTKQ